jgi:hypothetical protein
MVVRIKMKVRSTVSRKMAVYQPVYVFGRRRPGKRRDAR